MFLVVYNVMFGIVSVFKEEVDIDWIIFRLFMFLGGSDEMVWKVDCEKGEV